MEFLCWYAESHECLELPESFKDALNSNIPESILVTVGFQEYCFDVKSDEHGQWLIQGKTWQQYVIHRNVQPDSFLHLMLMEDGPIYLIHYNQFGVSMIHPKKTPRAMATETDHSLEYVEIHKQWFELISYEKKETNQIFIEDNVYDVQIYYKDGMPNGFCGQGWTKMYPELQIKHDEAMVFEELSPNVFTLSVFDEWDGKRTPTPKTSAAILMTV